MANQFPSPETGGEHPIPAEEIDFYISFFKAVYARGSIVDEDLLVVDGEGQPARVQQIMFYVEEDDDWHGVRLAIRESGYNKIFKTGLVDRSVTLLIEDGVKEPKPASQRDSGLVWSVIGKIAHRT